MSAVTPQEIVEHIRLTLCGHPYGLELAGRIEKHGIAPPDGWALVPSNPVAVTAEWEDCDVVAWSDESKKFPKGTKLYAAAPEVKP